VLVAVVGGGCARPLFIPERATRPYPDELHRTETLDIHVFREGRNLQIVNSTARSFREFDLWINQRYMQHVETMAPGETIVLSLPDFYDERGEAFNAGGFWRTRDPTPVRLVEIQPVREESTIGLITIRAEDVR
jgi:hypothetical protein